jgi:D-alanyl-lipoteichoic acid acyltransferase DltB (MBOAT superfamily)
MLFSSIEFAFFLPIVFLLYWFVFNKNLRFQNLFVLLSSYLFYGWWDWRFLSLIVFSSILDFFVGIYLSKDLGRRNKKLLLSSSIFVNLGFLVVFKYYNFFIDNFIEAFSLLGMKLNKTTLNILLPVGISFYTFQTLSYSIDIFRNKLKPTKDWISFFAFVSFFPQLVAGPIERAANLLPQFHKKGNLYMNLRKMVFDKFSGVFLKKW